MITDLKIKYEDTSLSGEQFFLIFKGWAVYKQLNRKYLWGVVLWSWTPKLINVSSKLRFSCVGKVQTTCFDFVYGLKKMWGCSWRVWNKNWFMQVFGWMMYNSRMWMVNIKWQQLMEVIKKIIMQEVNMWHLRPEQKKNYGYISLSNWSNMQKRFGSKHRAIKTKCRKHILDYTVLKPLGCYIWTNCLKKSYP